MILFDSHAHLTRLGDEELKAQIERAKEKGFVGILAMGGSVEANHHSVAVSARFHEILHASMGFDRDEAIDIAKSETGFSFVETSLDETLFFAKENSIKIRLIGEIGLDFNVETTEEEKEYQRELFIIQVKYAALHNLPVSVHCRGAAEDVMDIIEEFGSSELARKCRLGVVHCFTESKAIAERAISNGMVIGVSGIVTFRNADLLRSTISTLPIDKLLVETDCPYLAPVPLRGKKCEPSFAYHTAIKLSELFGMSHDVLSEQTTNNTRYLLDC